MDAQGARVLSPGRATGEGNHWPADVLPRLDGRRGADLELIRRCDDPGPAARGDAHVRSNRRGDAFWLRRVRCASRAVDPEHGDATTQVTADVRIRPQGDQ